MDARPHKGIEQLAIRDYFNEPQNRNRLSFSFEHQSNITTAIIASSIQRLVINRVLDVASGSGVMAGLVEPMLPSASFVLVDLAQKALLESKWSKKVQGEGERLPFSPQSFDLVLCRQAMHYMETYRAGLEFQRVLTSQGLLIVANEWWLEGDETAPEIQWVHNFALSRNKPPHILLSRKELLQPFIVAGFELLHRSDNYHTHKLPTANWVSLYDSPEISLSRLRQSLLETCPPSGKARGYPHIVEDDVIYVSKWMVAVMRTPSQNSN